MASVELHVIPWTHDHPTAEGGKTQGTVASHLMLDGIEVSPGSGYTFEIERGDFITVTIHNPDEDLQNRYVKTAHQIVGGRPDVLVLAVDKLTIETVPHP